MYIMEKYYELKNYQIQLLNLKEEVLEDNPEPEEKYLEILADYLILCMEKQERKERKILNDNRMTTVNKRETFFE